MRLLIAIKEVLKDFKNTFTKNNIIEIIKIGWLCIPMIPIIYFMSINSSIGNIIIMTVFFICWFTFWHNTYSKLEEVK